MMNLPPRCVRRFAFALAICSFLLNVSAAEKHVKLLAYLKQQRPKSEILVHETWAYRADDPLFKDGFTQQDITARPPRSDALAQQRLLVGRHELEV
jgi:hypothetical protein